MKKLLRNSAICLICRKEIESKHRHDFQECDCKTIFVDGGPDERAMRRGGILTAILDTSLWDIEDDRGWDD